MQPSNAFKEVIQGYLVKRAESDELFAIKYLQEDKNIDNCLTYILNEVQKSGCNGFADAEIYNMAVHFYDEPNIIVGNPINCKVVVNHTVELTEQEKEQVRKDAIKRAEEEAYKNITRPKKQTTRQATECVTQLNLF